MLTIRFATVLTFFCIVALKPIAAPIAAQTPIDLKQNWSPAEIKIWQSATQGSRLIPRAWLEALEQPGGTGLFLDADHIAKFRYLSRAPSGSLPIGFAIDDTNDENLSNTRLRWKSGQLANEPWVGFNCAACHTGEITYQGRPMEVEGGVAMADFQGFMEALNTALEQTLSDAQKFSRFSGRVLGTADTTLNREMLKDALQRLVAWQTRIALINAPSMRYGFGRLDAVGNILNKIALVVDAPNPALNPSNAPVVYPMLWNVPQLDRLQWNGMVANQLISPFGQAFDVGALGRNVGEVIGVFADIRPKPGAGWHGYASSVQISSLVSMEQMLGRLKPPVWPSVFGVPDPQLVEKGKTLFKTNNCTECHRLLDQNDLNTKVPVKQVLFRGNPQENRTDPWMACNAYFKRSDTGALTGTRTNYFFGKQLGPNEKLRDMLIVSTEGAMVGAKGGFLKSFLLSLLGRQPPPVVVTPRIEATRSGVLNPQLRACLADKDKDLGYKARTLTGIWAAAPYLHNGSVPTLYDLLLPPAARPTVFYTGSRVFDPERVGFVTESSAENTFKFDTALPGNSNAGHDYGSSKLTDCERKALVAYLKTL